MGLKVFCFLKLHFFLDIVIVLLWIKTTGLKLHMWRTGRQSSYSYLMAVKYRYSSKLMFDRQKLIMQLEDAH